MLNVNCLVSSYLYLNGYYSYHFIAEILDEEEMRDGGSPKQEIRDVSGSEQGRYGIIMDILCSDTYLAS